MITRIFLCCLFILPLSINGTAQDNGNGSSTSVVEDSRVTKVRFSGNEAVRSSTLELLVRTRSNRRLLNIPRLTVWYWLNSLNDNWGEPANRLNRELVSNDMDRISTYYRSVGYLDTKIDTIIVDYGNKRFEVSFLIQEGRQSIINQVQYSGFPEYDDPRAMSRFLRRSTLADRQINDTTYTANKPFSYDLIGQERTSIMTSLRNNGFASVQRDSVRAVIERTDDDPYNLKVLFLINPGKIFYFGDVYLNVDGPNPADTSSSSFVVGPPQTSDSTRIYIRRENEAFTRYSLLTDNIVFRPGDIFNYDEYLLTVRRFQNINMINVRQFGLSADGSLPDYSGLSLPVRIDMQTLPRHSIRFDVFGMQRLGFGAGAGLRYLNNNLLRRGESLEIGLNGSFENAPNVTAGLLRSVEGTIQYGHSRLTWPLGFLSDRPEFTNSRTTYQISLSQISQINFNVNANLRLNLNYQVQHSPTTTSMLDLFEFDWFDASPTPRFIEQIINEISDPLQQERILNDFSQQFNSTVRYTLRRSTTDFIQRNSGFYSELSIEFAGTVPYLIEKYLVRPGEPIQSTIPSLTLADSTLSYSRFIKAYVDQRRYIPISESSTLAVRGFAGIAYAYGENTQIPLNRRFFAGGSNDIRGWAPLRLGPGDQSISSVTVNGADIKFAGFMEARQLLLRNVLSTNWSVAAFLDAGNIWNGPRSRFPDGKFRVDSFYEEIAVGTGVGMRLDWEFVIFRVDMAWRAYDPARENGMVRGWFNTPNSYIHFGIGHAF
jgi:outer membrane protein insertion porin family